MNPRGGVRPVASRSEWFSSLHQLNLRDAWRNVKPTAPNFVATSRTGLGKVPLELNLRTNAARLFREITFDPMTPDDPGNLPLACDRNRDRTGVASQVFSDD